MPNRTTAAKSAKNQKPANRAEAPEVEGIALLPPLYGIEAVDQVSTTVGPFSLRSGTDGAQGGAGVHTGASVQAPIQRLATSPPRNNTGLPEQLKAGTESLSGVDLGDVRVHFNSPRPAQVHALAYTQGTDIHVGRGQERHLPHEAWHVVQQKQGRVRPTIRTAGFQVNDDPFLEREAGEMGSKAARGEGVRLPAAGTRENAGAFREGIRDFQAAHPVDSIRQGQDRVLGQSSPTAQRKDSSGVIQCYGSVTYEPNGWDKVTGQAKTGKKVTNLSNDFGTFSVNHGLKTDAVAAGGTGAYEIEIEMTPNKETQGSTIRFVQAVRRGSTPGNWATKATDPGMTADRARRAAEGGWRVDRADPTTDKTPFYGHKIDGTGTLTNLGNARPGTFGGTKPYLYDAPGVTDPLALEFSSDAMDDTTGKSFGKVAWGFKYNSAEKTYQEETPRMLPLSTNAFLNIFSEDRRRVAGEQAGREKWNEVYGAGGKGTQAGDADVKKVLTN